MTGRRNFNDRQINKLESIGCIIEYHTDEKIPYKGNKNDVEVVITNSYFENNSFEEFPNLKVIQLKSAGTEKIPMKELENKGIKVFNAKDVYSIPIAEWAIMRILEIYKKSWNFNELQAKRKWEKQRDLKELAGKTAVIFGFGSIGNEIAKRLSAFEVKIIAVDIKKPNTNIEISFIEVEKLTEALKASDIFIISAPLTQLTKGIINKEMIDMMKDESVIINISRGAILNENDLIDALKSGKFLGVALDVFENEPLEDKNPLWRIQRVLVSPHNSFVSERVNERLFNLTLANIEKYLKIRK